MPKTLHLVNGRIWTGWPQQPWANRLTVADGRVRSLDEPCEGADLVIDARGRIVTPGLIDSHVHLLLGGQSLEQIDLSQVKSRQEFEEAVARRHVELPSGQWLIGGGWSQDNWGGEMPDKTWLAAAGDRPTVCHRMDLHAALVNDAVLRMCDLTRPPKGGRIVRDSAGGPTGLMIEAAAWEMVNPLTPQPSDEEKRDMVLSAQAHAHRLGLTAVGSMEYLCDVQRVYQPLGERLTLRSRITLLDRAWPAAFEFARRFPDTDRLAVIGCKSFLDGTFGSRTARMYEEYRDDPGNRGMLVELAAEGRLGMWARAVAANGLSPSMHAIGDEAVRIALDAVQLLDETARPRIEHAQTVDPADIARFMNVIASMQPLHKAYDAPAAQARLGAERAPRLFPLRRLLDAGARLAFGSDWPVVSLDPLAGIRAAVTGLTVEGDAFRPQENLTVEEALRAYTVGAAFALQFDDAGVIRPGALGDFVVFDRDPFTADWAGAPPRISMTVVGGRTLHEADR